MALVFCPECGTQVSDKALACIKCAYPIGNINQINVGQPQQYSQQYQSQFNSSNNSMPISNIKQLGLDYYYELEFEAIHKSNESYKGNWNWYAFLFSWIWLFYKGCWQIGLIIFIINLLLFWTIVVPIILALIIGNRGTWFYYNVTVKNKQMPN